MTDRFILGQEYDLPAAPRSRVVGMDRYRLDSYAGVRKEWTSYTMESPQDDIYARWWLSDEKSGLYCWTACDDIHEGTLVMAESGLCFLDASGDSTIQTPYSAVLFYDCGEFFFCREVFEGLPPFYMRGMKIQS